MNARFYSDNLSLTLPAGDAGVLSTLWVMRACADDAVESGGPTARTGTALAAKSGRVPADQLRAVYEFLAKSITFKRDPHNLENVRHPDQLIDEINEYGQTSADCDDVATLAAALLRQMGLRPALAVVSIKPGGQYHHVTAAALVDGQLRIIDPQERCTVIPNAATRVGVLLWPE
jgi:hypothetical protein